MSTPYSPQHCWMEWLVDVQVASRGCASPVCLHTSQLGTATIFIQIIAQIHTRCDSFWWFLSTSAQTTRVDPELRGQSPNTPPAPTRPRPAALTIRVHPAALTVRVHPTAPTFRVHPAAPIIRVHPLPQILGYTRLLRLLGYTRLPWPVRVRSWGCWVRNGIKVQFVLY